jgi:hypothetical protein
MDVILDHKEVGSGVVDLIHVAQDRSWWWILLTLKLYILPPQYICVFHMVLTINSEFP